MPLPCVSTIFRCKITGKAERDANTSHHVGVIGLLPISWPLDKREKGQGQVVSRLGVLKPEVFITQNVGNSTEPIGPRHPTPLSEFEISCDF